LPYDKHQRKTNEYKVMRTKDVDNRLEVLKFKVGGGGSVEVTAAE